jgi:hypothetical protein
MGLMILRREVLPPGPARSAPSADSVCDRMSMEKQMRASITRSIWMMVLLTGLATTVARLLEMPL